MLWISSLKVSKSQKHFSLNSIAQKPNEIFEEILPYDFNNGYIIFQIPSQWGNIKNKRAPLLLCSNDKLWWDSGHSLLDSWWTQTFLTQLLSCQVSNKRNEGGNSNYQHDQFYTTVHKKWKNPQWHPTASTGFQQ